MLNTDLDFFRTQRNMSYICIILGEERSCTSSSELCIIATFCPASPIFEPDYSVHDAKSDLGGATSPSDQDTSLV